VNRENSSLLSVRDLVVRYRTGKHRGAELTAVRNVSLEIEAGKIFALVGESGSGKSSLAQTILRPRTAESGSVLFHGEDLANISKSGMKKARKNIQIVFQDPLASLSPRRTVLQTLTEPLNHFRIGAAADRESRAIAMLETVGLTAEDGNRYPHALSGGQRQRVALARALVVEPELIIADEPLSSLDVRVQAKILDLISDLRDKLGVAFLFVSHDLSVVRQLADTVAVMYLGRIVECAPAGEVFSRPAHPYTRSLLNAVAAPDPRHPAPVVLKGEPPSPLTPPTGCVFHKRCTEMIEPCSSVVPEEIELGEPDGYPPKSKGAINANHRVRCLLWRTPNA
jgi:oligopeptide/dipeptide ABC transporter ATP-binding protein